MIILAIILLAAAVLFFAVGTSIYRGNKRLIHDYHYTRVPEQELRAYFRSFAKVMFLISGVLIVDAALCLRGEQAFALVLIILAVGAAVSLALVYFVQKKYNGGVF